LDADTQAAFDAHRALYAQSVPPPVRPRSSWLPRELTFFAFVVIAVAAIIISGTNTGTAFYNASALSQFGALVGWPSATMRWAAFVLGIIATEFMAIVGLARAINYLSDAAAQRIRIWLLFASVLFSVAIMSPLALQLAIGWPAHQVTNAIIGILTPVLAITAGEIALGDIYEATEEHTQGQHNYQRAIREWRVAAWKDYLGEGEGDLVVRSHLPVPSHPPARVDGIDWKGSKESIIQEYWLACGGERCDLTDGEIALNVTQQLAQHGRNDPVTRNSVKSAKRRWRKANENENNPADPVQPDPDFV